MKRPCEPDGRQGCRACWRIVEQWTCQARAAPVREQREQADGGGRLSWTGDSLLPFRADPGSNPARPVGFRRIGREDDAGLARFRADRRVRPAGGVWMAACPAGSGTERAARFRRSTLRNPPDACKPADGQAGNRRCHGKVHARRLGLHPRNVSQPHRA